VTTEDGGWELELKMVERDLKRFLKRENLAADLLTPLAEPEAASAVT